MRWLRWSLVALVVGICGYLAVGSRQAAAAPDDAKSEYRGCVYNLRGIVQAIELYTADHKGRLPRSLKALAPKYMSEVAVCPATRTDTYSAGYKPAGKGYTVCCAGHHHKGAGAAANQPGYSSSKGMAGPDTGRPTVSGEQALVDCKSNLKNLGTALEMYSTDFGGRFPTTLRPLVPQYLRAIPECPAARKDTYHVSYRRSANPDAYTFFCSGHHHPALKPDKPGYNSHTGLETD